MEMKCYESGMVTFVPEDLYNEVMYPPYELPEEYRKDYTMEFTHIKRNQNVLVGIWNTNKLKKVKAKTNWSIYDSMPLLLDSKDLLDGFNCEVVAIEKENIQNEN